MGSSYRLVCCVLGLAGSFGIGSTSETMEWENQGEWSLQKGITDASQFAICIEKKCFRSLTVICVC